MSLDKLDRHVELMSFEDALEQFDPALGLEVHVELNDLATIPANLAGVPGISVPSGLADGLPAGFQVLAPALADDRVYRVGAAVEAALTTRWGGPLLDQAPTLTAEGVV